MNEKHTLYSYQKTAVLSKKDNKVKEIVLTTKFHKSFHETLLEKTENITPIFFLS